MTGCCLVPNVWIDVCRWLVLLWLLPDKSCHLTVITVHHFEKNRRCHGGWMDYVNNLQFILFGLYFRGSATTSTSSTLRVYCFPDLTLPIYNLALIVGLTVPRWERRPKKAWVSIKCGSTNPAVDILAELGYQTLYWEESSQNHVCVWCKTKQLKEIME